jgi:hypothetical protein
VCDVVLMEEVMGEYTHIPYHLKKLVLGQGGSVPDAAG